MALDLFSIVDDCGLFAELRRKNPYVFGYLNFLANNTEYAEVSDIGKLMSAIQKDSLVGFSVISFLRQAIAMRESWIREVCVGGPSLYSPGPLESKSV